MSYVKTEHSDKIVVLQNLKSREFDNLSGVKMTVENKTVIIDDFIESAAGAGLMVCIFIRENERETYCIMDKKDFFHIVLNADEIKFPVYQE